MTSVAASEFLGPTPRAMLMDAYRAGLPQTASDEELQRALGVPTIDLDTGRPHRTWVMCQSMHAARRYEAQTGDPF